MAISDSSNYGKTIKNLDGKVEIEADKMCLQLVDMRCTSKTNNQL